MIIKGISAIIAAFILSLSIPKRSVAINKIILEKCEMQVLVFEFSLEI